MAILLTMGRESYSFHHPSTEVRSSGAKGRGLFATARIARGEVVVITGGNIIPTSHLKSHPLPEHPFQIEKDFLLSPMLDAALEGIFTTNHSCDPNTGLRGQATLVALRDIDPGEEITFDYVMTDSAPFGVETFFMDCLCGSAKCRGRVSDMDWLRPELRERYRGYFSAYLQARIDESL